MNNREAYITLNLISGIGSIRMQNLCVACGSPANVLAASAKDLTAVPGIGPALAKEITNWREKTDLDKELRMAERAGVKIVTQVDSAYPELLREIHDPPLCLYVRGELKAGEEQCIGIVGSRRNTNYGRRMAEHLATGAVFSKWTVVSGLAYGVDAVAHEAVLQAKGRTIAVLGSGLTRIHPQDHLPLARRIVEEGGAVISEFPMEFPPSRQSFPMRNRIISGLSLGVAVVEAGMKSGALITAKFALEQGRQVFAVPGQADNPQAKGCNSLIKDGAKLTESFDDIFGDFEFLPGMVNSSDSIAVRKNEEPKKAVKDLKLSDEENKIMAILAAGECSADQLAVGSSIPVGSLLALLLKMEMGKLIKQLPGKRYALQ